MIFPDHKWTPDVSTGWRFCTCLNRCGWRRYVTTTPDGDETLYTKEGRELDFKPICEVVDEDA